VQIVEANGTLGEFCTLAAISSNNVTLAHIKNSHASGAWFILAEAGCSLYIQTYDQNAGKVGIGTGSAVTLTGGAGNPLIMILEIPSGGMPPEFSSANIFGSNPKNSQDCWVIGTSNDKILPSLESV
jgi:hypothetical protein